MYKSMDFNMFIDIEIVKYAYAYFLAFTNLESNDIPMQMSKSYTQIFVSKDHSLVRVTQDFLYI